MTDVIQLKARKETGAIGSKKLRQNDNVPGVIYGDNIPSRHFVIGINQFNKLLKEYGTSSLIDMQLEGEKDSVKVILHNWQKNPVTDRLEHVDLYQVRMDKKLTTTVHINFEGTSAAVKDLGGTLVRQMQEINIECLPADLIHSIDLDISSLKTFEDAILVKDLPVPDNVKVLAEEDEIVANVTPPRSEEEMAALDEDIKEDVDSVEVTGEKKDEESGEGESSDGEAEAKEEKPAEEEKK